MGYGIFLREIVALTHATSVGLFIASAVQALEEAQYLGAGTLHNTDGVFDKGQATYTLFLIASILAALSNGIALPLSLMSHVNRTVQQLWWPEHKLADVLLQIIYFSLDIASIILSAQALQVYSPNAIDWDKSGVD